MSRLLSRLSKVLISDAKRILITLKLFFFARVANRIRIIRVGVVSVLKKFVGNC